MRKKQQAAVAQFPPRSVARIQRQAQQLKEWAAYSDESLDQFLTELEQSQIRLKADYREPEKEQPKVKLTAAVITRLKTLSKDVKALRKELSKL